MSTIVDIRRLKVKGLDRPWGLQEDDVSRYQDNRHMKVVRLSALRTGHLYLLTPWCRVLEKLTGFQLIKKFPAFHGTRRFITALTSVRHLSLSCASSIQSIYPHPISWRSVLILSTHLPLVLPSGLLHSQEISLVLIYVRKWVKPRVIVRPEGLCQCKIPMRPSGIEPETFQLVA
jgi:hypothetical protein